jgi:hypothetical protein
MLERKKDNNVNYTKIRQDHNPAPASDAANNAAMGVVRAYNDTEKIYKSDPLGMYTGRVFEPDTVNAITNGYKIYMSMDDVYNIGNKAYPDQDADDL